MEMYWFVYIILIFYSVSNGQAANKLNNYKAYSDFIKYESGINSGNQKDSPDSLNAQKDNSKNIYTSTTLLSHKRDYVAPTTPPTIQKNSAFPPLPSKSNKDVDKNGPSVNNPQSGHQQSNLKRDYVANPFPALPSKPSTPSAQQTGKVKDLINFYDNRDGHKNDKPFSYSSIVKGDDGDTNKQKGLTSASTVTNGHPVTAPSFSSILSGSSKITPFAVPTTAKPFTTQHTTHRPMTNAGAMPSSIANNNRNGNNNGATDEEIRILSEDLLKKDVNNAAKYITVNYQEKTTSFSKEDKAPLPLVVIPNSVWNLATVKLFLPLLDNYERDTMINEYVTPQERNEENAFMDAIMATPVIRHLMSFLKDKGHVTPDPRQQRDFLKQLWFNLYSRGKGKISSSGFEHVFVSELKNGEVSGLHNWIYFAKEETANRANYLGYLKYVTLNDKGAVMKLHFSQLGTDKPVDSMFIGTSPELEIALYTLCFVTRPSKDCKLKLSGKDVGIITHPFRYRSKNYIGSAYAQI